ncbi:hypothetical protein QQ045_025257 [Rhodiola kirilowii]
MAISTQQPLHLPRSSNDRNRTLDRSSKQSVRTNYGNASKSIMRVCFSFAAYAKSLIDHLITNCHIPVQEGLSDDEFRQIEATLGFQFPPDLRSILREGIPVGAGFPNWRSASKQQLQVLIKLPLLGISKSVGDGIFWLNSWGVKPRYREQAVMVAEKMLRAAPPLIPIYKNFYIPSDPNLAGNPVFDVTGGEVRVAGFDIAGFFEQRVEFSDRRVMAPAWKATETRRIVTWTDMAEAGREGSGGWWCGAKCGGELAKGLEEAFWKLRDGGWDEEEVMEMMQMDGQDYVDRVETNGVDESKGIKGRLCELLNRDGVLMM